MCCLGHGPESEDRPFLSAPAYNIDGKNRSPGEEGIFREGRALRKALKSKGFH